MPEKFDEHADTKAVLRKTGYTLLVFGAGSCLIDFFDREFLLLIWIWNWGEGVAWIIRIGLTLAGLGCLAAAAEPESTDDRDGAPDEEPDQDIGDWIDCRDCGATLMPGQTDCYSCGTARSEAE